MKLIVGRDFRWGRVGVSQRQTGESLFEQRERWPEGQNTEGVCNCP
ncbi:hypothetical protein [Limnobaculum parvum]|nr:hypothetical protein [Limnobaculum parvum]